MQSAGWPSPLLLVPCLPAGRCSWKSCHFTMPFKKSYIPFSPQVCGGLVLYFSFTSLSIVLGLLFQPLHSGCFAFFYRHLHRRTLGFSGNGGTGKTHFNNQGDCWQGVLVKEWRSHCPREADVSPLLCLDATNLIHFLDEIFAKFNIFPVNEFVSISLCFLG